MFNSYRSLYPDTKFVPSIFYHFVIFGWREGRYLPFLYKLKNYFLIKKIKKISTIDNIGSHKYILKEFDLFRRTPNALTLIIVFILMINEKKNCKLFIEDLDEQQISELCSDLKIDSYKVSNFYVKNRLIKVHNLSNIEQKQIIVVTGTQLHHKNQIIKQVKIHANNIRC